MQQFACPYSYGYCGSRTSEVELHPIRRNNLKIEISNYLFQNSNTCYYVFYVPNSSLDMVNMRYFYDIEITNVTNVNIQINNGTSFETANDPVKVTFRSGYRFQYTAENNKVFMSFTGSVPTYSKVDPLFTVTFKLRSFEKRPTVIVPVEVKEEPEPEPDKSNLIDEEEE